MLRSLRNPHLFLAMLLPCLPACGDDGGGTGDGSTSTTDPSTSTATDPTNASADTSVTTTDVTDPTEASSSGTTDPTDATSTTASDSTGDTGASSQVRVLHLGVRAPAVDVFANGDGPVFEALEFRNSTQYAEVPPGDYTFEVSVSGTPASEAVLAPELTLDAGVAYTAVAIGDLEMTDGAPGLQAIALVDDAEGIDAANVRVTVVHAAPAVGQVDIWEISADPVPLLEDVAAYFEREVKPHVRDAWMDRSKDKVGYEINFNRHFYVFTPPRPLAKIDADLKAAEDEVVRLLREVTT